MEGEAQCERVLEGYGDMMPGGMIRPVRETPIPFERRRQLCRVAEAIAGRIEEETTERERHLLRRMLSNLLDW